MNVALIYPPTCDPTAPYLAIPTLTAHLRANGVEVLPIDANIEAYAQLLHQSSLRRITQRLERRLTRLERKGTLNHVEQLAYSTLWQARDNAQSVPGTIEDALAVLRDRSGTRFFDPLQYETASTTVESALRLISAAFTPLSFDFKSYRTPFSLLTIETIEDDARPERNPFHEYFQELCKFLEREQVKFVGISIVFPGQIQPAYALALTIRRQLPDVYVTVGGPAITQLLVRLQGVTIARMSSFATVQARNEQDHDQTRRMLSMGEYLKKVLKPFHSAVLFEGEYALLELVSRVARGEKPTGIIPGTPVTDLGTLPAPDFDGLPLDKYLSPALVLPYDPTRGCYWGKCAFCHYGLAECGTARYRQRPAKQVVEHVQALAERYQCNIFYFSQDSMSPNMALRVAQELVNTGISCRWATDMRPEPTLTSDYCQALAAGGALSIALGIESAAPRILNLMNKGIRIEEMTSAVTHLANAGIAVEAMCFTDFPTETYREALATIRLIEQFRDQLALFICGQFDLAPGALVARTPERYGIREIWHVVGDELLTGLFYEEQRPSKSLREREEVDAAIDKLARSWWLHRYPWAGSLSTAHTLLWYDHYGPEVFKRFAGTRQKLTPSYPRKRSASMRFAVEQMAQQAQAHEVAIWHTLIREKRTVTRALYHQLAEALPTMIAISHRLKHVALLSFRNRSSGS